MDNCIFCKIVKGDIPSYTIYEDEIVKVFLDINPLKEGHTLIIPKTHYKDLDDIDQNTLNHIMEVAKKIKLRIEERLNPDGIRLLQNNGVLQEVKHYHLHLIPTYKETKGLSVQEVFDLLK